MSEVSRFLLVGDHDRDQLVDAPRVFVGEEQVIEALDAYDETEQAYADRRDRYEVLLVVPSRWTPSDRREPCVFGGPSCTGGPSEAITAMASTAFWVGRILE